MRILPLLLFLLLVGCGHHTEEPKDMWNVVKQRDFTGGETQAALPEAVARNQLLRFENCLIDPNGYITSDYRTDQVAITSAYANNGFAIDQDTNGNYTIYANYGGGGAGNTVYTYTYNTTTHAAINITDFTGHAVSGGVTNFYGLMKVVRFLGKLYIPNTQSPGIINLTDYVLITNGTLSENVVKLREYVNRLWAVRLDGSLCCSNNGDATTWNALNLIYLPNRDKIKDFIPVQGGAIIIGTRSAFAMYGSDYTDISFVKIVDDVQLVPGASVQVGNSAIVYAVTKVLRLSLNGVEILPIQQDTFFKNNIPYNYENYASRFRAAYLPKSDLVIFTYPNASPSSRGMWINLKNSSVGKIDLDAEFILPIDSKDVEFLHFDGGNVYKGYVPVTTHTGSRTSVIQTRYEDCGSTKDKLFREFTINVSAALSSATIKYYLNDDTASPVTVASDYVLAAGDNTFYLNNVRGQNISMEITIATTAPFTVRELRMRYREIGPNQ